MTTNDDKPGEKPPSRLLPVLVLAGLVAAGLLAWQAFPAVQGFVARQDCTATGRTNC